MAKQEKICTECYHVGVEKTGLIGNMRTEAGILIALVLFGVGGFFFPLAWFVAIGLFFFAIVYSIYRRTGKVSGCPKCGQGKMIPLDTERAKNILAQKG